MGGLKVRSEAVSPSGHGSESFDVRLQSQQFATERLEIQVERSGVENGPIELCAPGSGSVLGSILHLTPRHIDR